MSQKKRRNGSSNRQCNRGGGRRERRPRTESEIVWRGDEVEPRRGGGTRLRVAVKSDGSFAVDFEGVDSVVGAISRFF